MCVYIYTHTYTHKILQENTHMFIKNTVMEFIFH